MGRQKDHVKNSIRAINITLKLVPFTKNGCHAKIGLHPIGCFCTVCQFFLDFSKSSYLRVTNVNNLDIAIRQREQQFAITITKFTCMRQNKQQSFVCQSSQRTQLVSLLHFYF